MPEALLALEFLGKGYTRSAAGKAFQAWRALLGALLALEEERLEGPVGERARRGRGRGGEAEGVGLWSGEHERALQRLREALGV